MAEIFGWFAEDVDADVVEQVKRLVAEGEFGYDRLTVAATTAALTGRGGYVAGAGACVAGCSRCGRGRGRPAGWLRNGVGVCRDGSFVWFARDAAAGGGGGSLG